MVTPGEFEVGQEVRMKSKTRYGSERSGTVVEVGPWRVRVMWGARNGIVAKRTWVAKTALVQVIRGGTDPFSEPGDFLPETA